jgi:predicted metal-binding membrane protein
MFAGMWTLMMIPMMLPAIVPVLWQQRRYAPVVATAYFAVWTAIGMALYPIGISAALAEMRSGALSRTVPLATGVVVLLAGCVQMTRWKMRELACCRGCEIVPDARRAWTYGLRTGVRCALCCSGFMIAFVVVGVMNVAAMAVATAAIAVERVAPRPDLTARIAGVALIAFGTVLVIRAI